MRTWPLEVLRAAAGQVREWGGRQRVAVGIDDAHLLDDTSSTLIAHLVRNRLTFAIMTVRAPERVADVLLRLCEEGHAQWMQTAATT